MKRACRHLHTSLKPPLLPGIRINTSPTDFYPIKQVQLMRFDGKTWVRFGELMSR